MIKRILKLLLGAVIAAAAIMLLWNHILKPQIELARYPISYAELVEANAAKYGVPPEIVYAVILTESGFDKTAVSKSGAKGLMQLMDETNEWIAQMCREDVMADRIFEPEVNISRGVWLLSHLYKQFGTWREALAAYNAGYGRVVGWLDDTQYSANGVTLDYIPFTETREYVERVLRAAQKYREIYYN